MSDISSELQPLVGLLFARDGILIPCAEEAHSQKCNKALGALELLPMVADLRYQFSQRGLNLHKVSPRLSLRM
jgi:hypothetical protein